ncbi:glycosyltransferase [Paeniglutamicibacter sulfureus]|uniref:Glycosyltransferase involved in cell wall biosynthesis n=1 Tax=Paeniglutamicibacter sulfureus TaxID=43666 RepID=A0ABU2BMN1_9MICC|nr:glycosyltransferase [Paeniglutamicibacter sulfureus]MDR7359911.1 glycosyltransferase involved in cell wall biosynthesis [Paeniglutamicibacter sulfureus]
MSKHITAIASYGRRAGSSRVRLYDWIDFNNLKASEEVYINASSNSFRKLLSNPRRVLAAEMSLREIANSHKNGNLIISRRATPFSNGALESKLLSSATRGVYDFDDSLSAVQQVGVQRLWSLSKTWKRAVATADIVIAGNDYLAEEAGKFNDEVVIIPSCVNPNEYRAKTSYESVFPRAVWIGSPSTESYLSLVAEPLLRLHSKIGLRLTVISSGDTALGGLEPMVDRIEWSPDNYKDELAKADIGIMPLVDNKWARGKCAYKLLQYGAAGLPMIGSPVGSNQTVLGRSRNLISNSADDWFDQLDDFFNQPDSYREALGGRARELVQNEYSFQAWQQTWMKAVGLEV